jgi:hypothetical protein
MANFETTAGTSAFIDTIIRKAEEKLILISPYLQISKTLLERLKDADRRKVKIIIIYGKDDLKPNQKNSLAEISNIDLYYFENLHAKCYLNENSVVITSMNMYEYSEKTNREMGVSATKKDDSILFKDAWNEAESILRGAIQIENDKVKKKVDKAMELAVPSRKSQRGYCIRCEERVPFSIEKPFCLDCFLVWSQFKNVHFEESNCHSCGEYQPTSMVKPLCSECFTNHILPVKHDSKKLVKDGHKSINQLAKSHGRKAEKLNKNAEVMELVSKGIPTKKGLDQGVETRVYMGKEYAVFPNHLHAEICKDY